MRHAPMELEGAARSSVSLPETRRQADGAGGMRRRTPPPPRAACSKPSWYSSGTRPRRRRPLRVGGGEIPTATGDRANHAANMPLFGAHALGDSGTPPSCPPPAAPSNPPLSEAAALLAQFSPNPRRERADWGLLIELEAGTLVATSMNAMAHPVCVAVINMKGGVGKTTVATLLARRAARLKYKVLAIDLDPQANLSQALMGRRYKIYLTDKSASIVEVFKGFIPPTSASTSPGALAIDKVTIEVEENLLLIPSRFDFSDNLINVVTPDPTMLSGLIANGAQDRDLIVIDCAPTESIFTRAAYHASRYLLVPVRPEFFATIGFPLLNDSLEDFRKHNPTHLIDVAGVIVNNAFYDGGNDGGPEKRRAMDEIKEEAENNEWHIFANQIPFSRGFPKMMRGDFRHVGNASEYTIVCDKILRKIGFDMN